MTIFWSGGIEHVAFRYCEECGCVLFAEEGELCAKCEAEGNAWAEDEWIEEN